jgi:hypothetical protein
MLVSNYFMFLLEQYPLHYLTYIKPTTNLTQSLAVLGVLHGHLLLQILEPLINLATKNKPLQLHGETGRGMEATFFIFLSRTEL